MERRHPMALSRRNLLLAAPALLIGQKAKAWPVHGAQAASGLRFNLILDPSWTTTPGAPADYVSSLSSAVSLLQAAYTHLNLTINCHIGYTTQWLSAGLPAVSVAPSTSQGTILAAPLISYPTIRSALAGLSFQSASLTALLANTPAGASLNGTSSFSVSSSSCKTLGLFGFSGGPTSANDPIIDGSIGIGSGWSTAKQIGVFLHEFHHMLAAEQGFAPFVFSRFTGVGTRDFTTSTGVTCWFSLDNGTTHLADYDTSSDPADFSNTGIQGSLDCFNAQQANGANQFLSTVDNQLMNSMGFQ